MNRQNYIFFEEYKHLDKLCGEIYRDQHGVSKYIDDMKNTPENGYRNIPNWKADLEHLIQLRHFRNYLAHAEDAFNEDVCTLKDIEWCKDFYNRILNQSDPLSMLYQNSKAQQQIAKTAKQFQQYRLPKQSKQSNKVNDEVEKKEAKRNTRMNSFYWIILFLIIAVALLIALPSFTMLFM